eukprot:1138012-Pelagomonas_calceolata.AAC.1
MELVCKLASLLMAEEDELSRSAAAVPLLTVAQALCLHRCLCNIVGWCPSLVDAVDASVACSILSSLANYKICENELPLGPGPGIQKHQHIHYQTPSGNKFMSIFYRMCMEFTRAC